MKKVPVIAGNWKMNGLRAEGLALTAGLIERGELERAVGVLGVSIDLLPQNPYAHYHLGLVKDRQGLPEEATAGLRPGAGTGIGKRTAR